MARIMHDVIKLKITIQFNIQYSTFVKLLGGSLASKSIAYNVRDSFVARQKASDSELIWVDFAIERAGQSSISNFEDFFHVQSLAVDELQLKIFHCNNIACMVFELDYPDIDSLRAISAFRYQRPEIPVLLITVAHSEDLVLWALRNHIWDFYYKPLDADHIVDICCNIQRVADNEANGYQEQVSAPLINAAASPKTFARYNRQHEKRVVDLALNYIKRNIDKK